MTQSQRIICDKNLVQLMRKNKLIRANNAMMMITIFELLCLLVLQLFLIYCFANALPSNASRLNDDTGRTDEKPFGHTIYQTIKYIMFIRRLSHHWYWYAMSYRMYRVSCQ